MFRNSLEVEERTVKLIMDLLKISKGDGDPQVCVCVWGGGGGGGGRERETMCVEPLI